MITTVEATYDGDVLRPLGPLAIEPNTKVRITIEAVDPKEAKPVKSFLETARNLKIKGPPDWSTNLDHYLYGTAPNHGS